MKSIYTLFFSGLLLTLFKTCDGKPLQRLENLATIAITNTSSFPTMIAPNNARPVVNKINMVATTTNVLNDIIIPTSSPTLPLKDVINSRLTNRNESRLVAIPISSDPVISPAIPTIPGGVPVISPAIPTIPGGVPAIPNGTIIPSGIPSIPGGVPSILPAIPTIPGGIPGGVPSILPAIPTIPGGIPGGVVPGGIPGGVVPGGVVPATIGVVTNTLLGIFGDYKWILVQHGLVAIMAWVWVGSSMIIMFRMSANHPEEYRQARGGLWCQYFKSAEGWLRMISFMTVWVYQWLVIYGRSQIISVYISTGIASVTTLINVVTLIMAACAVRHGRRGAGHRYSRINLQMTNNNTGSSTA